MREIRNAYKDFVESLQGRDHLEGLSIDQRIILKWILGKSG
jgi:hypothetical protein